MVYKKHKGTSMTLYKNKFRNLEIIKLGAHMFLREGSRGLHYFAIKPAKIPIQLKKSSHDSLLHNNDQYTTWENSPKSIFSQYTLFL